ncbi:Gfo/Idh/MocA family oxidoreductase [Salinimicrobium sediminilitoris]|uniref:Gfo/Idh/MocA family oxidoreductase n=1 Tax=Salinimicrobium sediminilitoris TaxID=2876715 RepID=UPI001E36CB5A|nr:Gfo/Idh/MocA family oxidoreductase [Salinimicrobium sediminilitoris]MCC8358755.1 Gfo/Idh/MocA family oxidoreductase [Salinimicrobium sediminilitoris]
MAEKIKLGVIGMSEGNGHPYSWSAIFNGYDREFMKECPFPAIPAYLEKQNFPEDGLGEFGEVTHIWTQDREISDHIAKAAKIPLVVQEIEDLINKVDAVLLARDDSENHLEMARPFLNAGLPVFIDKPFAIKLSDAEKMLSLKQYESQIFTCSAIRFAEELRLTELEKEELGKILYIEAGISKLWDTYAIHVLDPMLVQIPDRGELKEVKTIKNGEIHQTLISWENVSAYVKVTGPHSTRPSLIFYGQKGKIEKSFSDTYSCFKSSLLHFIKQVKSKKLLIEEKETMELVKILEWGKK